MIRKLDRWIFGYGSPLTLGVYRAVFGSIIFIGLLMLSFDFGDWFTETGLVPQTGAKLWAGDIWRLSLLNGVTDSRITGAVFAATLLASLTTALGLWTRVSTILLALGLVSLHHRNPFILNGGDSLIRVTAIYFAVMPVGAAFSLDRLRIRRRGGPESSPISLWPQRLIQVQMAIVYGTTVLHKLTGVHWMDGTAAWYPPHLTEFNRFPTPGFVDFPPFLQAATWGTLVIEVILATLVFWRPARKWVLLSGLVLHGIIEYRFNIPLFAFLSVAQYISHYDGEEIAAWWKRRRPQEVSNAPTPA